MSVNERADVPLNVNGTKSLVRAVDAYVARTNRRDPETRLSRGVIVRRAIRAYLAKLGVRCEDAGSAA